MTKKIDREMQQREKNLMEEASRLDETLEIMEKHSDEMVSTEEGIKEEMRKWDREHKNAHLHSIPKSRKHVR
jgi:hypothetical protein